MSTVVSRARTVVDLKGCYYVYGSDKLLLDQAVQRLLSMFSDLGALEVDCARFQGSTATQDDVTLACLTMPFIAPRRLVIVHDAEALSAEAKEGLCNYLRGRSDADNSVLVFVEDRTSQEGKPLVDKRGRLFKAVSELGQVSEYSVSGSHGGVRSWIRSRFESNDKVVTTGAAGLLETALGSDLTALANEIDKICAYCAETKKIDIADMAPVMHAVPEVDVFDFVNAVIRGRKSEAVLLSRRLSENAGDTSRVLGLLEGQIRLLLGAKLAGRATPAQLAQRLKIRPGRAYHVHEQCKIVSTVFLGRATQLLARADFDRKSGRGNTAEALEDFVLELLAT